MAKKIHKFPWDPLVGKQAPNGRIATIIYYGPTAALATKVAVSVLEGDDPDSRVQLEIQKWFSDTLDIRRSHLINKKIIAFLRTYQVYSVLMRADKLMGCPHEEAIDYPEGEACPHCPYWQGRDRFTHELVDEA